MLENMNKKFFFIYSRMPNKLLKCKEIRLTKARSRQSGRESVIPAPEVGALSERSAPACRQAGRGSVFGKGKQPIPGKPE